MPPGKGGGIEGFYEKVSQKDHGFTGIADVKILDEDGSMAIPVTELEMVKISHI